MSNENDKSFNNHEESASELNNCQNGGESTSFVFVWLGHLPWLLFSDLQNQQPNFLDNEEVQPFMATWMFAWFQTIQDKPSCQNMNGRVFSFHLARNPNKENLCPPPPILLLSISLFNSNDFFCLNSRNAKHKNMVWLAKTCYQLIPVQGFCLMRKLT